MGSLNAELYKMIPFDALKRKRRQESLHSDFQISYLKKKILHVMIQASYSISDTQSAAMIIP